MQPRQRDLSWNIEGMQREMERLFNDLWGQHPARHSCSVQTWRPPTDVYETQDALVIKVELAGMREQSIEVMLEGRTLSIYGTRPDDRPSERISYHLMGVNYGTFCVQLYLPYPVEGDAAQAAYEDGFLIIRLPRRQREGGGPQRVDIRVPGE